VTPDEILTAVLGVGLIVWPEGADALRVRGPSAARAKWVDVLCQNKPNILHRLWGERLGDHFEERAAILEYEAGLPRSKAEEQARRVTTLLALNLGAPWAALR
jgi:hypothetical protein